MNTTEPKNIVKNADAPATKHVRTDELRANDIVQFMNRPGYTERWVVKSTHPAAISPNRATTLVLFPAHGPMSREWKLTRNNAAHFDMESRHPASQRAALRQNNYGKDI